MMRRWKYHLNASGEKLRELIHGDDSVENCAATLDQLRICCSQTMKLLQGEEKELYYDDFDELYWLMDGEPQMLREHPEELFEWGFSGATDLVNDRLAGFYDLCDRANVWIAVPKWC